MDNLRLIKFDRVIENILKVEVIKMVAVFNPLNIEVEEVREFIKWGISADFNNFILIMTEKKYGIIFHNRR
ncbi:MAG: hypothetical protein KQ78_01821 [Candidatus Izimaplasma bacterium HR2]|nr:MAG: hypothetical protein KQ78_01821 [Candidatus Izimaplasma bacterium HR2]